MTEMLICDPEESLTPYTMITITREKIMYQCAQQIASERKTKDNWIIELMLIYLEKVPQ